MSREVAWESRWKALRAALVKRGVGMAVESSFNEVEHAVPMPEFHDRRKPTSKADLLRMLAEIGKAIEADDSFGGWLEYDALEAPDDVDFLVCAGYRVGNSQGQGGMVLYEARA